MPKTKNKADLDLCQGTPFDIEFKGKFQSVEMFLPPVALEDSSSSRAF